jgi:hypothetical protein
MKLFIEKNVSSYFRNFGDGFPENMEDKKFFLENLADLQNENELCK